MKPIHVEHMDQTTAAYIAGMIDGEGTFSDPARLVISNCHLDMLEWIQSQLGGNIYIKRKAVGNWNTVYDYKLRRKQWDEIAHFITPYLKIKTPW